MSERRLLLCFHTAASDYLLRKGAHHAVKDDMHQLLDEFYLHRKPDVFINRRSNIITATYETVAIAQAAEAKLRRAIADGTLPRSICSVFRVRRVAAWEPPTPRGTAGGAELPAATSFAPEPTSLAYMRGYCCALAECRSRLAACVPIIAQSPMPALQTLLGLFENEARSISTMIASHCVGAQPQPQVHQQQVAQQQQVQHPAERGMQVEQQRQRSHPPKQVPATQSYHYPNAGGSLADELYQDIDLSL